MNRIKVVITGAGFGGSNNLIASIFERDRYFVIGTNIDRFKASKSNADKNYVLPHARQEAAYIEKLNRLIEIEKPDLLIPNNETEIEVMSRCRDRINCKIFLPDDDIVLLCKDKMAFYEYSRLHDFLMAETYEVSRLEDVDEIFDKIKTRPLWCRLKKGSGSKAATKVQNPEQAKWWIRYWNEMRGVDIKEFMLSEYLPGRDFAVQSTWKNNKLVLLKVAERLQYYGGDARPSGMSSTPELAQSIYDQDIFDFCIDIVNKVARGRAHGNFCLDLKMDAKGRLCVTEINIGRFCMINPIFNFSGKHSMIDTFIKLALDMDEELNIDGPFDFSPKYLCRDLDTLPLIISDEEIDMKVEVI